jgi:hypothetical protein
MKPRKPAPGIAAELARARARIDAYEAEGEESALTKHVST